MSTVQEIESAIRELPSPQLSELSRWFETYLDKTWDARMKADAQSGKLDFLIDEARAERAAGTLRSFP